MKHQPQSDGEPAPPPSTEPPPSEPAPTAGDVTPYAIKSTACLRSVPLVGAFLRYTAAPGEITVGDGGERCETFYGDNRAD
jgi:hypothetical protein